MNVEFCINTTEDYIMNATTFNCLTCGKTNIIKRNSSNKYCSNTCQQQQQFETETFPKFLKGEISTRRTLIRCLTHLHGYRCMLCGNEGTHNNIPLVLQLDHLNGDASNDSPSNLRLLCPNCHSQTDTFVAKNKGYGRTSRGVRR
jgi:predicted RNA-binding Zn-ribbon protein involved in translation (DUF1610 family)